MQLRKYGVDSNMLDLLIGKQRAFLQQFKPQHSNMYVVEFPEMLEDARSSGISIGTNLAAAATGAFAGGVSAFASPSGAIDIGADISMMTDRIVLPGVDIETITSGNMTFPDELPKMEGQKRATFTIICSSDGGEYQAFREWKDKVIDSETRRVGFWSDYAEGQDIVITLFDRLLQPKVDITLKDCYPVNIGGLSLSYQDENELLRFEVTFVVRADEIKPHDGLSSAASGVLNRFSVF